MTRSTVTAATSHGKLFLCWGLFYVCLNYYGLSFCTATRHSFHTTQDPRHWIGPLGPPFGFLTGGVYNLTVVDFKLEEDHKLFTMDPKEQNTTRVKDPKRVTEVGFLLKRFRSESDFFKYYEAVLENSSCIFQKYTSTEPDNKILDDVPRGDDDSMFANTGIVNDPGGEGIPLYMRFALNPKFKKTNGNVAVSSYTFLKPNETGLYFLMYQVCDEQGWASKIRSTFTLDFHFYNKDTRGHISYLSAGEMAIPTVYFFFFMSFGLCTVAWITNIRSIQKGKGSIFADSGHRPAVYAIHQFISLLLILKTCTVLMESIRYHYIRVSGHAELWSVLYYIFAFLKGLFMFTVILLIGSGWSFVKSYLTQREKYIILTVLVLQVLDNVALLVLSQITQGERSYSTWNAIMHLIDILCCCAILLPLVWQVNALEKSLERHEDGRESNEEEEGQPLEVVNGGTSNGASNNSHHSPADDAEKNEILSKLRLFRSFYLLVVAYIYLTRVVVYLFTTTLDYRHLWIQPVIVELVTLTFFVVIGLKFRPMEANPYFSIHKADTDDHEVELLVQPTITIMDSAKDAKLS